MQSVLTPNSFESMELIKYSISGSTEQKHSHVRALGVIGGHDVDISKYPWQVSLHHNEEFERAGVLISPEWVLTSYPFSSNETLSVRAGSSSWKTGGQLVYVKAIIPHPDAHPDKPENNIALLELSSPVNVTSARAANLPRANTDIYDNALVDLIGWGRTNASAFFYPTTLQGVTIPVVTRYYCHKHYESLYNVTTNMFCAGGSNLRTACFGDDGGSVSFGGTVVGIVNSWGIHCDLSSLPSVFMEVSKYRDWIKSFTGV